MEIEELLERLDGNKVRVVYDSPYAIRAFIFSHFLPKFPNVRCVVYTDTMRRRLERAYSSLRRFSKSKSERETCPEVICVGSEKIPFGKLLASIPLRDSISNLLAELLNVLNFRGGGEEKKSCSDARVALFGFYMLKAFYPERTIDYFRFIEKIDCTLFDFWPEEFCRGMDDLVLRKAYDVTVKLKHLPYHDETYSISISESILFDVPPAQRVYQLKDCRFVPSD